MLGVEFAKLSWADWLAAACLSIAASASHLVRARLPLNKKTREGSLPCVLVLCWGLSIFGFQSGHEFG
jgi:hypothetical protein